MKFLYTLLLIAAIYFVFSKARFITKRLIVRGKLKSLEKEVNIKLKFTRKFIPSLLKMSHAPDVCAEIGDTVYLMRFYNGRGKRTQAHFANEEYSVIFSVLLIKSLFGMSARLSRDGEPAEATASARRKVIILPKLEIPIEYKEKKTVPILIFNPAPSQVSYVSDEKTSIKLAFTGDEFRGIKIFTGTTVVNFLDREARYFKEQAYNFD